MKKRKMLATILGVVLVCIPVVSYAENSPSSFQDLAVPAYKGVAILPTARKLRPAGYTILNYNMIGKGTGSYALDGFLRNYDTDNQAGDYRTGIGTGRTSHPNWSSAQPGDYYFQFINHNSVSRNVYIYGSWAPDDK